MEKSVDSLEKTQAMECVSDKTQVMPRALLTEVAMQRPQRMSVRPGLFAARIASMRGRRVALFVAAFFLAAFAGYFTLRYFHEQADIAENTRLEQKYAAQSSASDRALPSLDEIKAKTDGYVAKAAATADALQETLTEAQKGAESVKAAAQKADELKKQAERVLADSSGLYEQAQAFVAAQTQRLQALYDEWKPREE